jgi:hypothetical protein
MKKSDIVLSPKHPSMLENDFIKSSLYAPVVVNQDSILMDGYRRYQMEVKAEIAAVQMEVEGLFIAAFEMNRNTRTWDEIDHFFWGRWADSLGVENTIPGAKRFPSDIANAPEETLSALANRRLQLGQVMKIMQCPASTWTFFTRMLSSMVRLNVNETALFLDMTFDLANRWQIKNVKEVMENEILQSILREKDVDSRRKGTALLKAMRNLRYPLYQRKTDELSAVWQQLKLDKIQANLGLFLDRGVLELTVRARSQEEMSKKVKELFESLSSPAWNRIWK